ncbi:hypothetical protein [Streptomyces sp. NPDC053048]|uniref:hypothetical protein n=1 Tax=Streptomyces sp. NPDC053048 TaxID=3365694 RepID=UPI0037D3DC64
MNYAIRHPRGKAVPGGGPRFVRIRRRLVHGADTAGRLLRRIRVRLAARTRVAPARRWTRKWSAATNLQRLSFLCVPVVAAWVGSAVYAIVSQDKSGLERWCEKSSTGCTITYGFLAPFLSLGLATCLFLAVQYLSVRRPLSRAARKNPRSLVPTAGPTTQELETRLEHTSRSVLPPCLVKDRKPLHPGRTVGMAEDAPPGSACLRDCPFQLCPYPAMGEQPRAELRETFCRQQQALLRPYRPLGFLNPLSWLRRRKAPWQGMTGDELRRFWEDMAVRSRTPSC